LEDLTGALEREAVRPSQRRGDVLDDAPVLPRLAWTVDRLVDLDDAALDLRDGPFVFFVQTPRQHDLGVPCRVVQEEVDGGIELEFLETARHEGIVGKRDLRIEADRDQRLDLAAIDLAEEFVGIDAGSRQFAFVDPPDAGDVAAVIRVADVSQAWQLIALL